ncbi:MAG: ATP-binding cassette domain-containing protein [Polyangiales bacterium]
MLALREVTRVVRDGDHPRTLFARLSLELPRGACGLLLGAAGVGKSTLLAVAAALTTPDAGALWWEGEPISDARERRRATYRRDIAAFAMQSPLLLDDLTAAENLALARRPMQPAVLDRLGVTALLARPVARLSEGERQRVSLARALGAATPLVLLDEPSASLDDAAVSTLAALLDAHRAAGGAALVTTHDPRLRDALRWDLTRALHDGALRAPA